MLTNEQKEAVKARINEVPLAEVLEFMALILPEDDPAKMSVSELYALAHDWHLRPENEDDARYLIGLEPLPPAPAPVKIDAGINSPSYPGDYSSHWGLCEFYSAFDRHFVDVIGCGQPFRMTLAAKKEIEYASIEDDDADPARVNITVTVKVDDPADLLDTVIWDVCGKNYFADCGESALRKKYPGLEADSFINWLADQFVEIDMVRPEGDYTATGTAKRTPREIKARLRDVYAEALLEKSKAMAYLRETVKIDLTGLVQQFKCEQEVAEE